MTSLPRRFFHLLLFLGVFLCAKEPLILKDIFYYDDISAIENDVEYAKERCKLDLRLPGNEESLRPVILFFHGGGLRGGSKYFPQALKNTDAVVVSANYRLSNGRGKCPDYLYDAAAAAAWVFRHIAEYGGDPDGVIITGHSAGAYLAVMVGMDPRYLAKFGEKNSRFLLVAPVSGQMTTHAQILNERLGTWKEISDHVVVDEYAPLWHAGKGLPPLLLYTGGWEMDWPSRPQENQLLYSVLRNIWKDDRAEFICLNGFTHGQCIEPALVSLLSNKMWPAYAKRKRTANMPPDYLLNSGQKIRFQAQRTGKARMETSAVIREEKGKLLVEVSCREPDLSQLVYGGHAWNSNCLYLYLSNEKGEEGQWVLDSRGRAEFYSLGMKEPSWKTDVSPTPQGWNAHFEINLPKDAGKFLKANLVRDRHTSQTREITCWSPIYGDGFQEKEALVPLVR